MNKLKIIFIGFLTIVCLFLITKKTDDLSPKYFWNILTAIPICIGFLFNMASVQKRTNSLLFTFSLNMFFLVLSIYLFVYLVITKTWPASGFLLYFITIPLTLIAFILWNKFLYHFRAKRAIVISLISYAFLLLIERFYLSFFDNFASDSFYIYVLFGVILVIIFPLSAKDVKAKN